MWRLSVGLVFGGRYLGMVAVGVLVIGSLDVVVVGLVGGGVGSGVVG